MGKNNRKSDIIGGTAGDTAGTAPDSPNAPVRIPDPGDPILRELERRRANARRMSSGRLSTVLSPELKGRI